MTIPRQVFSLYFMEFNFFFWSHSDLLTVPSKEKNLIFKNSFFIHVIYHWMSITTGSADYRAILKSL